MTRIPYLPLYDFASRPLNVDRLRAQYADSRRGAASAKSRWQAAGSAFRSDVIKAVKASQDNRLVDSLTSWTGRGSAFMPRTIVTPAMPPSVTHTGAAGLIGTAVVYGAAHALPVAGLTLMGLTAEISALVGLSARYAIAGVAAVGAGVFGLLHGVRQLFAWDTLTTLHPPFSDATTTMQPLYDKFFGLSEKKPWPPAWETMAGLDVTHQFTVDCTRLSHTTVRQTLEGEVPALCVELAEPVLAHDPSGDPDEARQQIAVNKLLNVCEGNRAWASHTSSVLTQSLGNVPFATLSQYPMIFQGGNAAFLCSPNVQSHNVARRDDDTLVIQGDLTWNKNAKLLGQNGKLLEHGISSSVWFKYSLTVKRPEHVDQVLDAKLERAEWGMGSATRYTEE